MLIKSISIKNYKCHKNIEKIPIYNLTAIIGENDSGKTAIIDFIEIMLTNKIPSKNDYYREFSDEIEGYNEINQTEIEGIITFKVPEEKKESLRNFIINENEIILKKTFKGSNCKVFIYKNAYLDNRFNNYISMKALDLKALMKDLSLKAKSNQALRREAISQYLSSNEIEKELSWIEIAFKEISSFLPSFVRYGVDDYKNPDNMVFKVLQEVFENQIYQISESGEKLYKDVALRKIMSKIENTIKDSANQFKNHIQRYNDKIKDITFEPNIDLSNGLKSSHIKIKDETGIFYPLENRGFGTQKRIFMAIFDWNKEVLGNINQNYVIRCYDEPDNSLHIEAQRKLYKSIKKILSTSNNMGQALICTHSLFMIDSVPANSINLIKRDCNGASKVEYLKYDTDTEMETFITLMCREMGLANSHIFFEKAFILVEGQTEVNFLPLAYRTIYNSSLAEDGISIINLDGNGAAINFLKLLVRNKRESIILFLDNDSVEIRPEKFVKSKKLLPELSDSDHITFINSFFEKNVLFIGDKEFEDSISNETYARILNIIRKKNDSSEWNIEEIESIRNKEKFSENLVNLVAKNCVPKYINKPELGKLLGLHCKSNEMPDKVLDLFNRVREIAQVD